jgi:hypothetical protein
MSGPSERTVPGTDADDQAPKAERAGGLEQAGTAERAEGSEQAGTAQPAEGSEQAGTAQPAEGSEQAGTAQPAEGSEQAGTAQPAEGSEQAGTAEQAEGSEQAGSPELVSGGASAQTAPFAEPGFLERGRMRRRARYLRQLREVQLRDIGGFMLELQRFGRAQPDLVQAKLAGAASTDSELRALERALGDEQPLRELRAAGIGGACPRCRAVFGSSDRYCASCGESLPQRGRPEAAPLAPGDTPR